MVNLLTPSTTADGDTASDGLAQQKERTGMNRRVNRRTATIAIVSTLLLGLLAAAAVAQIFSLASVTRQAQVTQQDPDTDASAVAAAAGAGNYRLSSPNETDTAGTTTFDTAPAGRQGYRLSPPNETEPEGAIVGQASSVRGTGGAGIGPVEYLPGEENARPLPSLTPDREAAPDFGPQP